MIPTLLLVGLVIGLVWTISIRVKLLIVLLVAIGWAAYVAFGLDGPASEVALGFGLAVANTVVGAAIGTVIALVIQRLRGKKPAAVA